MSWSCRALATVERLHNGSLKPPLITPFYVCGAQYGIIRVEFVPKLAQFPAVFNVQKDKIELKASLDTKDKRTEGLHEVFTKLRDTGECVTLKGWRNERYTVYKAGFKSEELFDIERAAVPILGCKSYGVHMNGYIYKGSEMLVWIGRRSPHKAKFPNMLDNVVAGGISTGYGVLDTLIKEADEEANIPPQLMTGAKAAGCLTYIYSNVNGISPETEFIYDVELPAHFTPANNDGEVAGFELMTIPQVQEALVQEGLFKPNCAVVMLDFLIRHGFVTPDNTPDYVDIVTQLHNDLSYDC